MNRNLVETTACILHELAHWIRWFKFKEALTPSRFSFAKYYGADEGQIVGEVGWWLEYKLLGGPLYGARSIDNKVNINLTATRHLS